MFSLASDELARKRGITTTTVEVRASTERHQRDPLAARQAQRARHGQRLVAGVPGGVVGLGHHLGLSIHVQVHEHVASITSLSGEGGGEEVDPVPRRGEGAGRVVVGAAQVDASVGEHQGGAGGWGGVLQTVRAKHDRS